MSTAAVTTFLIGLRHGLDWDHLAAITDLTGSGLDRRRGAALALVYAAGHGTMVLALGVLAVAADNRLPSWIDPVMQRVVGVTLLVLAVALVRSLRTATPPRSRGVILLGALSAARDRLRRLRTIDVEHEHGHDHSGLHEHDDVAPAHRKDPAAVRTVHRHRHRHRVMLADYGMGGAMLVGALHGFGAETGTQALVLVNASNADGVAAALVLTAAFGVGVFATTGMTAAVAVAGWSGVGGRTTVLRWFIAVAAAGSATLGAVYLVT